VVKNDASLQHADPELIYTARAIGAVIGLPHRKVFHAAACGYVPGLFKQGKILTLHVPTWREGIRAKAIAPAQHGAGR